MKMHLCIEVPLSEDEDSMVSAAFMVETKVRERYDGARVTSAHEVSEQQPIPDPKDFMRDQIDVLRKEGLLPKREAWEQRDEDDDKET